MFSRKIKGQEKILFIHKLAVATLLTGLSTIGLAATIIVNSDIDQNVSSDGKCTLREALNNANANVDNSNGDCAAGSGADVIEIHGDFAEIDLQWGELSITESVHIKGAPVGGVASRITIDAGYFSRILNINTGAGSAHTVDIENVFFRRGRTSADSNHLVDTCEQRGAAICAYMPGSGSALNLVGVEFVQNDTLGRFSPGGAIYGVVDKLTIDRGGFLLNTTKGDFSGGGAVHLENGTLTIASSDFTQNRVEGPSGGGGALDLQSGSLSISNSNFVDNLVMQGIAGAMRLDDITSAWITNAVLLENKVSSSSVLELGRGTTIYASLVPGTGGNFNPMVITNSLIDQNQGTAIKLFSGALYLNNTTISRNTYESLGDSGVVYVQGGYLQLNSSTIAGNIETNVVLTEGSGGLFLRDTPGQIANSTLVDNQTVSGAGGILLKDSTVSMVSTILAENTGTEDSLLLDQSTLNVEYSQFGDPMAEINGTNSNNIFIDVADVTPISDFGCSTRAGMGPQLQCVPVTALMDNSPALDKGTANGQLFDQRGVGFDRFVNGTDIGAYEYQVPIISMVADNVTQEEGDAGTTAFGFTVTRNGDLREESWADWNIIGSGASPATLQDFNAPSWGGGSVYFAPDQAETSFNVFVIGDTDLENDEQFTVSLGALVNGKAGNNSSATGTIINDDSFLPAPILEIEAVAADAPESDVFYSVHQFKVTRRFVTSGFCSVEVVLSHGAGNPTNDDDFLNANAGVVFDFTMAPGVSEAELELQIAADIIMELDEKYRLTLQNPSGCILNTTLDSAQGIIRNDDTRMSVAAVTIAAPEGDASDSTLVFDIIKSGDLSDSTAIDWQVTGTGANPATADDFVGGVMPSGTVLLQPGMDVFPVSVLVNGDNTPESDETLSFSITVPPFLDAGTTSVAGTIVDDDAGNGDLIFIDDFEGP